jgi:hypothetical protein
MIKQSREILVLQLKSLVVYQFLDAFNKLEKIVKNDFKESLKNIDKDNLNKLYFYYGGLIGTYIDNDVEAIKLNENKYKKEEKFGLLKINQILKFNKTTNLIKKYNVSLNSVQRESTAFDLQGCIIKLINMRNVLAHEIYECSFKDKDIIELLSNEKIRDAHFEFLANFDTDLMDDMTKTIISNYYYMSKIISLLENETNSCN